MFLQQLVNGITIGSTYALVAVGFTMVYGVLQLVNFANGSFYILGAYLTLTLLTSMKYGFYVSMLIAVVSTGLLGALMDSGILTRVRKKDKTGTSSIIATLGVSTVVINMIIVIFGSESKYFPDVFELGKFYLGSAIITWNQFIIAAIALVIMLLLSLLVYKTKIGSAMLAISQNQEVARLMGINVNRVITITFFIGTACAAIAGNMVAMYFGLVDTTLYLAVSMKTFASVVLGGIGVLPGAMLGGIIMGLLETFITGYISSAYKDAIAFLVLIIVLILKPSGLLGIKNFDKV